MEEETFIKEELKKSHLIHQLLQLGIYKIIDKQLYEVSIDELEKTYEELE